MDTLPEALISNHLMINIPIYHTLRCVCRRFAKIHLKVRFTMCRQIFGPLGYKILWTMPTYSHGDESILLSTNSFIASYSICYKLKGCTHAGCKVIGLYSIGNETKRYNLIYRAVPNYA